MRVVTLTLNPAIDYTVHADHFRVDTVNAGTEARWRAAGKGVNVAVSLAGLGVGVTATGFLGDRNPDPFEALFRERGVEDAFVRLPGETRVNVKIVDRAAQQTTDVDLPGLAPSPAAVAELGIRLAELVATHEVFVLSGSLPPGVPAGIYADLIRDLSAAGRVVALDTSGPALATALAAVTPTILKPNVRELEEALGRALPSEAHLLDAALEIVRRGTELVAVSMGARGALFVTAGEAVLARPPGAPDAMSTVGAGDAMVAGIVAARLTGLDLPALARLATACSVAAITRRDGAPPARAELDALAQRVHLSTSAPNDIPLAP
ncbi:MAG: 1-phosphofructokinase [Pseudomonadota bacterium]|nr:1-phosphofructokinase [Pseudomonadota bacterium]